MMINIFQDKIQEYN